MTTTVNSSQQRPAESKPVYASENNGFDQWSELPPALVRRIFSFVPWQEALEGKVLCKKWCAALSTRFIDVRTVSELKICKCHICISHGKASSEKVKAEYRTFKKYKEFTILTYIPFDCPFRDRETFNEAVSECLNQ